MDHGPEAGSGHRQHLLAGRRCRHPGPVPDLLAQLERTAPLDVRGAGGRGCQADEPPEEGASAPADGLFRRTGPYRPRLRSRFRRNGGDDPPDGQPDARLLPPAAAASLCEEDQLHPGRGPRHDGDQPGPFRLLGRSPGRQLDRGYRRFHPHQHPLQGGLHRHGVQGPFADSAPERVPPRRVAGLPELRNVRPHR